MAFMAPLYLGFDLSTQQLKAVVVTSDLVVQHSALFDFDTDAADFGIKKGVLVNESEGEVFAPVAMWLRAIDVVLERLKSDGIDFARVKGISGAGMQHGSIYWSYEGITALEKSGVEGDSATEKLETLLKDAFSWPFSPNWQDASTQRECDLFDDALGEAEELAKITGSKAHHVCIARCQSGGY